MSVIGYRIYIVTCVDHPELRDPSFRVRTKTGRWLRAGANRYRAADGTMYDDSTPERAEVMRAAEIRDYSAKEAARALAASAGSLYS